MKTAEKFFKILDKVAFPLTAISVGGMLLCVFLQVIARTLRIYIAWTTELSQYFFLWATCFASYIAARRGKLIDIDLLQKKMPDPVRRVMKFVSWGAGAYFYGMVIYYCAIQLPTLMKQTTPILKWPMGLIYIVMMAGLAMLCAYFIYVAILGLLQDNKKEEKKVALTAAQRAEEVE